VVAGDDTFRLEELGVSHEFAPYGCQHNYNAENNSQRTSIEERGTKCQRTRSCKLRVNPLAHDALQAHARAHEPDARERQRVCPRRIGTRVRSTRLPAFPYAQRRSHREQRLDHRAKEKPQASLRSHAIADAAEEGTEDESRHRGEGLLVCEVEGGVALAGWALEETGKGEGKLGSWISSEGTECSSQSLDVLVLCYLSGRHTIQRQLRSKPHHWRNGQSAMK
jgi:hypothetical protein